MWLSPSEVVHHLAACPCSTLSLLPVTVGTVVDLEEGPGGVLVVVGGVVEGLVVA